MGRFGTALEVRQIGLQSGKGLSLEILNLVLVRKPNHGSYFVDAQAEILCVTIEPGVRGQVRDVVSEAFVWQIDDSHTALSRKQRAEKMS